MMAGDCGTDRHDRGVETVSVAARPDQPGLTFDRSPDRNTRASTVPDTEERRT